MSALHELLVRGNESIPLDVAVLQLAEVEFPGLALQPSLHLLDSLAAELRQRVADAPDGDTFVRRTNDFLFGELGFHGNEADYHNPLNSCLNEVLVQRVGLPITLAVLYMELGRRLERPVYGIGLPGHFLVQYADHRFATYIDPFHQGRLLTREDCLALARQVAGVDITERPDLLRPVSKRAIVLRMLNNLRAVYFQQRSLEKASQVMDLLIQAMPESADERKQRGLLRLQRGRHGEAGSDLRRYLELAPNAEDRGEIQALLNRVYRHLAAQN